MRLIFALSLAAAAALAQPAFAFTYPETKKGIIEERADVLSFLVQSLAVTGN
jgi:hypothetical protein